jgi:hypothetical protein
MAKVFSPKCDENYFTPGKFPLIHKYDENIFPWAKIPLDFT